MHVRVLIMNKNPSKRGNVSAKQWALEHKRGKIMDGEETSNDWGNHLAEQNVLCEKRKQKPKNS